MPLKHLGFIELPEHVGEGGFDHAAVDRGRGVIYVAHTANDAVDVIDGHTNRYLRSISGLKGVAGALVDETSRLGFTSNRGENTVGIFPLEREGAVEKVPVGVRPNGLAYDPGRGVLLAANVGDPSVPGSTTCTLIDVRRKSPIAEVAMPGRTRWAVFDPEQELFFINIADPFRIVVVNPGRPDAGARHFEVPARGPHGLDLDVARGRLYCACDEGRLMALDSRSGEVIGSLELSGTPDVVFLNPVRSHLYVAIGDPGVIDVVDVAAWKRIAVVATERGAHTIAFDESAQRVYAFLPRTHRAQVLECLG